MKIVKPKYYKDFKCIAGECPDSCCQGWEVDVDENTLMSYQSINHKIKDKIDSVLSKDEFDNIIFTLTSSKRCPFLNDENLCDIHSSIGQEYTPYTCKNFPRFYNSFGSTREIGISLSCPVASDMIWNLEDSLSFEEEINNELPDLNDIDAQVYFILVNGRKKAFEIAQNQDLDIKDRMIKLLDLGVDIQNRIEPYKEGNENIAFFDVFVNPEVINEEWVEKVNNPKNEKIISSYSSENVITYFLYKYFLQAVYDYDALSKIKMAVMGVLIITYFGYDSWTIHLWSKETEHSQYNMDRYKKLLKDAKCLCVDSLKKRIMSL